MLGFANVDMSHFCNEELSIGDPVEFCIDQTHPNIVRKYNGGVFAGVSMNAVVNFGCSDFRFRANEVSVGSKLSIATSGSKITMSIVGNAGDYIRPKKDGTWKVGCKRKNAVGQIVQSSSDRSIVRLI
jgi:hypothetical protein